MVLIPVLNDDLNIIATVEFEDNLTLKNVPDYVNENGRIGLKRLSDDYDNLSNEIVFMFYDPNYPGTSYAEIISELEAYKLCLKRGRLDIAVELELKYNKGVEII